jgi:hypothetical protein
MRTNETLEDVERKYTNDTSKEMAYKRTILHRNPGAFQSAQSPKANEAVL